MLGVRQFPVEVVGDAEEVVHLFEGDSCGCCWVNMFFLSFFGFVVHERVVLHTLGLWNKEPDENTHGEAEAGEYDVSTVVNKNNGSIWVMIK